MVLAIVRAAWMPLRWTALRYFQSDALNLLRIYRQTNKDLSYFSSVKSKANGRLIQKLDENSARRCRVFTQVKIEQTTNSG